MDGYRQGGHAVYKVVYHVVLVTKYRRKCINEDLGEYLKRDLTRLIQQNKGFVHAIEYDQDHVHILAELPVDQAVAKFIGVLKGVTSRNVRRDYAEYLKKWLWGGSFWSASYFVASAGGVTLDVIRSYVENQRSERGKPGRPPRKKADSSQTDPAGRNGSSPPVIG